jgi:hypothetical protein
MLRSSGRVTATIAGVAALWFGPSAFGSNVYNANINGHVTEVITYIDGTIYFTLDDQPTMSSCTNHAYFSISSSTPSDFRQQVLSRLLTAYSLKESVWVGYDNTTCASDQSIWTGRVG